MGWASRKRLEQCANTGGRHERRPNFHPKEDLRLSERLLDLIAPYRANDLTRERYEELIESAATAWNLSLLPELERSEALGKALRSAKIRDAESVVGLIMKLVRRKEALFPDDDRAIVAWEVSETGDQYGLTVMSAV